MINTEKPNELEKFFTLQQLRREKKRLQKLLTLQQNSLNPQFLEKFIQIKKAEIKNIENTIWG